MQRFLFVQTKLQLPKRRDSQRQWPTSVSKWPKNYNKLSFRTKCPCTDKHTLRTFDVKSRPFDFYALLRTEKQRQQLPPSWTRRTVLQLYGNVNFPGGFRCRSKRRGEKHRACQAARREMAPQSTGGHLRESRRREEQETRNASNIKTENKAFDQVSWC